MSSFNNRLTEKAQCLNHHDCQTSTYGTIFRNFKSKNLQERTVLSGKWNWIEELKPHMKNLMCVKKT